MKIELWPENAAEVRVVIEAMAAIQTLRDEAAEVWKTVRTPHPVPPEEIEADDMVGAGRSSEPSDMLPPPVSSDEATAALKSAYGAGVKMEKIVELLTAKKVSRVPELSDEDRAEFVAQLRALESEKRGTL